MYSMDRIRIFMVKFVVNFNLCYKMVLRRDINTNRSAEWVNAAVNSDIMLMSQLLDLTHDTIPYIKIQEYPYNDQMLDVDSLLSIASANNSGNIVDLLVWRFGHEYGLGNSLQDEDSLFYTFHDSGPFDHLSIVNKYGRDYYIYALKLAILKKIITVEDLVDMVEIISTRISDNYRFYPLILALYGDDQAPQNII